jgi:hypothetical protein
VLLKLGEQNVVVGLGLDDGIKDVLGLTDGFWLTDGLRLNDGLWLAHTPNILVSVLP